MEKVYQLQDCCYEDLKGNAMSIVSLIIDAYKKGNKDIPSLFYDMSEDEFDNRYFLNIDWDAVIKLAVASKSRKETHNYLNRV